MSSSSAAGGRHGPAGAVHGLVLRERPSVCSRPHGAAALERGRWGLGPSRAPEPSIHAGARGGRVSGGLFHFRPLPLRSGQGGQEGGLAGPQKQGCASPSHDVQRDVTWSCFCT